MKKPLSDKFTLGAEAAAAAGPVGRNTSANTDVLMTEEIQQQPSVADFSKAYEGPLGCTPC